MNIPKAKLKIQLKLQQVVNNSETLKKIEMKLSHIKLKIPTKAQLFFLTLSFRSESIF